MGEWQSRRPVLMVVDPDQPAAEPNVAKVEQPVQSVLLREQFLEYVEYLASLPGVKIHSVPGDVMARFEAAKAAGKALAGSSQRGLAPAEAHVHMHLLQLPPYERFVAAYPLTPEGVLTMSSMLSWSYLQANLTDEAMQIAVAANRLAEGSEVECITAINLAFFESQIGEPDEAEARLRQVMEMPLPKAKDRRTSDICLAAPLKLADILSEQGKWEEADRVYRDVIERGFEWDREYPNDQIGASYATSAYRGRLNVFVKAHPDDAAGAETLIEEIVQRVPLTADELRHEVRIIGESMHSADRDD
jgi:pentatricopeptide repeat protein